MSLRLQMSTKEKLIHHVMKEEPVGSRCKVTVVGVGMVGMASAVSILLKVSVRFVFTALRDAPRHVYVNKRAEKITFVRTKVEKIL